MFASITGAWIETLVMILDLQVFYSRPSRARGLKPIVAKTEENGINSRPSRARGLKLRFYLSDLLVLLRVHHGRVD